MTGDRGGRATGGAPGPYQSLDPALDPALLDPPPMAPAPPPGKRALTDHLPARLPGRHDERHPAKASVSEIHRPRVPLPPPGQRPRPGADPARQAPAGETGAAPEPAGPAGAAPHDDPFGLHLIATVQSGARPPRRGDRPAAVDTPTPAAETGPEQSPASLEEEVGTLTPLL